MGTESATPDASRPALRGRGCDTATGANSPEGLESMAVLNNKKRLNWLHKSVKQGENLLRESLTEGELAREKSARKTDRCP